MNYKNIKIPQGYKIIQSQKEKIVVPDNPIIPFIIEDNTNIIHLIVKQLVNIAVKKAYDNNRKISWMDIYLGKESEKNYGKNIYLPDESIKAIEEFGIAIRGPSKYIYSSEKSIYSINFSLEKILNLYICCQKIYYFFGVPSTIISPQNINMTIFQENSEDIYTGIEFQSNSLKAEKMINFLRKEIDIRKISFTEHCGIGLKISSRPAVKRIMNYAIQYAINNDKKSITLVHKGDIMKFTESDFRKWGYEFAKNKFNAKFKKIKNYFEIKNPKTGKNIILQDILIDDFLQYMQISPEKYDIIVASYLNGFYISKILSSQIGFGTLSSKIFLGRNIVIFDNSSSYKILLKKNIDIKDNPIPIILSSIEMLQYIGWNTSADFLMKGLSKFLSNSEISYQISGIKKNLIPLNSNEIAKHIIQNI